MKKVFLIVSLALMSLVASAQVAFGVKAGFVTSLGFEQDWSAINMDNLKIKTDQAYGFDAGLMLRLGYRFYGQVEANYHFVSSLNQIGTNIGNTFVGGEIKQVTEHAINVPVMAGVKLVDTKDFNLRIMAGPTFNFNLSSNPIETTLVDDEPRICSFGLDCGLGVDIWIFTIDARYRLVQPGYAYTVKDMVINTNPINSFEISLGCKFFDKTRKR